MLTTPLRRAIPLATIILVVLVALIWGVGTTLAPDRLVRRLQVPGFVRSMEFSPDGRKLFATANRKVPGQMPTARLRVWESINWTITDTIPDVINLCGFSADGTRLLTQDQGTNATLWNLENRKPVNKFPDTQQASRQWSALSPDGTRVAVIEGRRGKLRIRDARTGRLTYAVPDVYQYSLVGFAADSQQLAFDIQGWGGGGGVYVVDVANPVKPPKPRFLGVAYLAFVPDGKTAVGTNGTTFTLWSPKTWKVLKSFPTGVSEQIWDISVSRDGRLIAISTTSTNRVYDTSTGWEIARIPTALDIHRMALSPDGSKLAVSSDSEIQVWEIGSRDRLLARALFRRLTGRWFRMRN